MGGFGSGRWNNHRQKTQAEHCRWFTVAVLVGDRPPTVGRAGKLVWQDRDGNESVSVAFTFATDHSVVLAYRWGDDRKEYGYPLPLIPLSTPNGGTRYLVRCPLTVNDVRCHRRVAKLYQPPRSPWFGCRHCHRLTYRSRQAHDPGGVGLAPRRSGPPVRVGPESVRPAFALTEWERRSEKAMKRLDPKPPPRRRKSE